MLGYGCDLLHPTTKTTATGRKYMPKRNVAVTNSNKCWVSTSSLLWELEPPLAISEPAVRPLK